MKIRHSSLALALAAASCLDTSATAQQTLSQSAQEGAASGNAASDKYKLSDAQLGEARARADLANQIVQNVSADAEANAGGDSWRIDLLSTLYNTPSRTLRDIRASATTLHGAWTMAAQARVHPAASAAAATGPRAANVNPDTSVADGLGSSVDSLVFTPMTPCRFIDTRNVGGPVGTTAVSFDTTYSGSSYGGNAGCTLPGKGEPAIAANITIVNPTTAAGYLTVRPYGSTQVTSWMNWYQAGAVQANAGIVSTGLIPYVLDYGFQLLTGGGTVQVVVDYFGYFAAASSSGALHCITQTSSPITGTNGNVIVKSAYCPAGTTATSPVCDLGSSTGMTLLGSGVASDTTGSYGYCRYASNSGLGLTYGVTCCAMPF